MELKGQLMDAAGMENTFRRLAHQVIEGNDGTANLALIGIKTRGVVVAQRMRAFLQQIEGAPVPMGEFDIALYRDDLGENADIAFLGSEIGFGVDGKDVLICDDVFYTGRTVRAAISEVMQLGRPRSIQFLVLIDRGHRELPFHADYTGKNVPTSRREGIAVRFLETDGEDVVYIYDKN